MACSAVADQCLKADGYGLPRAFLLVLVWLLVAGTWFASSLTLAADETQPSLTAWQRSNEGRLTIEWPETARVQQKRLGDRLVLRFASPLAATSTSLIQNLSNFVDPNRTTIEGAELSIALKPGVFSKVKVRNKRLVTVDFFRDPEARSSPIVKASTITDGVRLSFDWPGPTKITKSQDLHRVDLKTYPAWDIEPNELAELQQRLKPWFRSLTSAKSGDNTAITLVLEPQITPSVRSDDATRTIIDLFRDASVLPTPASGPSEHVFIPEAKPSEPTIARFKPDETRPPLPKKRPQLASTSGRTTQYDERAAIVSGSPETQREPLVIGWDKPVAAAIFTRAGYLWAVFDEPDSDLLTAPPAPSSFLGPALVVAVNGGTAFRFPLREPVDFTVSKLTEGHWLITPTTSSTAPGSTTATIQRLTKSGKVQVHPVSGRRIISVIDPDVGDRIEILPVDEPNFGQPAKRRFVDFEFLPARQGLVWRPLSDDLVTAINKDRLEFNSPQRDIPSRATADTEPSTDPTIIKAHAEKRRSGSDPSTATVERTDFAPDPSDVTPDPEKVAPRTRFKLADSGIERPLVNEYRRIYRQAIRRAKPEKRDQARINLARLLLSERLVSEARTVLETIEDSADDEIILERQALNGVMEFLNGSIDDASALLLDEKLSNDSEIDVWRAALTSARDEWPSAAETWRKAGDVLDNYPPRLKLDLGLMMLEAAIETDDDPMIRESIRRLDSLPLNPYDEARVDAMKALKAERQGDFDQARALLADLTESPNSVIRTFANFKLVALSIEKDGSNPTALAALDRSMPQWRGHPREQAMLDELARRFRNINDVRKALNTWRRLIRLHPEAAKDETLTRTRQNSYAQALANATDPTLAPLDVYSIYLDFIELLPTGEEAEELMHHLARHLVDLDLLDEAINVLQPLIQSVADEQERADLAADTATLMLQRNRAAQALSILDEANGAGNALPPALDERLRLLRAQSLARLGRTELAIRELRDLQSQAARRLQAVIHWDERNWPRLAAVADSYFAATDPMLPMTKDDQELVLWLSLARRETGSIDQLSDLRKRFSVAMQDSPYAEAFNIATQTAIETNDIKSLLAATEIQLVELQRFRSEAFLGSADRP